MEEEISCKTFKGLQHNKFGRMGYLAALYFKQRQEVLDFWTEKIDEDSSKLLLVVTAYLDRPWFHQGRSIYKTFNDIIIQPL